MTFKVIDKKTGEEADAYKIALKEDWAKCLVYCDIEGFALTEDGVLVLMDECGNVAYCPDDRFKIVFEEEPKGDCISRSVLDEIRQLYKKYQPNLATEVIEFGNALEELIDNAPTVPQVTVFAENADETAIEDMKAELRNVLVSGRPQGEWKFTTHHARRYRVCPFCAAEKLDDLSAGWNFCWHCGAQMKGGAE